MTQEQIINQLEKALRRASEQRNKDLQSEYVHVREQATVYAYLGLRVSIDCIIGEIMEGLKER